MMRNPALLHNDRAVVAPKSPLALMLDLAVGAVLCGSKSRVGPAGADRKPNRRSRKPSSNEDRF
jgi:hypothetical protein